MIARILATGVAAAAVASSAAVVGAADRPAPRHRAHAAAHRAPAVAVDSAHPVPGLAVDSDDPGRWVVTSRTPVSSSYRQGLASDPSGNVFFSGPLAGIYRTRNMRQTAANTSPIPTGVAQREQYNHIGDIAWDASEAGRLLLPLESYNPFAHDTNPSKTGSFAVVDPATLRWLYYVKLDPSEIAKAQWVAVASDGLAWTIAGHDLLAYRLADITRANAAPSAPAVHSVRRIAGVAPAGAGGAAELGGRLYLSTSGGGVDQVFSVDPATGASRVEYEARGNLEPEGVDAGAYFGGILHVELVSSGFAGGQLLNMVPKGTPLRIRLAHARVRAARRATVKATVVANTSGGRIPLAGVQVRVGRAHARTNAAGRVVLHVKLTRGSYRVVAFFKGLRSATARLRAL